MALARQLYSGNRTILIADNRGRLVFSSKEKKGVGEDIEFWNPGRNGAVFCTGSSGMKGFIRTKHEASQNWEKKKQLAKKLRMWVV